MPVPFPNGATLLGNRLRGVGDPSSADDGVNKSYVDAFVRGLSWKIAADVASTTNIDLSAPGASHDGVTFVTNMTFLAKNQSTASQNGLYDWNGAAVPATRRVDADSAAELNGATVTILQGTANADKIFRLITDGITLGSTSLVWTELGGGGAYTAGTGITESPAGTFNLDPLAGGAGLTHTAGVLAIGAGTGITVNANDVALAATAAGGGLTHSSGVLAVGAGSGITVNTDDIALASSSAGAGLTYTTGVLAVGSGTGITVAADAISADLTVLVTKYATDIGNNSSTAIVVTHSLNTRDVDVVCYDKSTPWSRLYPDIDHTSVNTVTLTFGTAPTTNQYRVFITA